MTATPHPAADISPGMIRLLAFAAGLIVASLYYAQTLVGSISAATGLSPDAAGLIVTLTQAGYALGLLFIVPLGDLLENRRLVFVLLLATSAMLAAAAFSTSATLLLAASLGIGLGSVAAQVLVPFAAHLAREETRGQTVGKVVSGLLLGIMLARPAASLVADHFGWHAVYGGAALAIAALAFVLRARLPQRLPGSSLPYGRLIGSMWQLLTTTPVLRRHAAYHAAMFASFSLFWTVTPLVLAGPRFQLSQTGIAIFALGAEVRSRLNGIFFALFFAGGALGSALGTWVLARHGWQAALLTGLAFPAAALIYWISEWAAGRRLTQSAPVRLR